MSRKHVIYEKDCQHRHQYDCNKYAITSPEKMSPPNPVTTTNAPLVCNYSEAGLPQTGDPNIDPKVPKYSKTLSLIIRTPKKGTPNFGKP